MIARLSESLRLGWGRRLPLVLQTEAAECGLACLAMLAGYHGQTSDLAELRRRFGMSLKGATLKDLVRVADALGFASRPLRLEPGELAQLKAPCVLHWDLNHFVVLKGVRGRRVVVHDPAVGVRRLSLAEVSRHFTGVALECTPLRAFERAAPRPRVRLRALVGTVVGLKRSLAQLLLLALAIEVLAVISPLFMQWVVDDVLVTGDRELLTTLVVGFGLLLLVRTGISAMRGWLLMAFGASLRLEGPANLLSHLLRLPAAYFEARHLGDVMSRFGSQETILDTITTEAVEAVLDGLLAGVTLVVMVLFAPSLACVVVAGALLYVALQRAAFGPLRRLSTETIVWEARRDSHFLETLRGIKTIKLFNAEEERRGRWLNLLVQALNRQLSAERLSLVLRAASALLVDGLTILVVWLGARRVLDGSFSVGMLLAFLAYKGQFLERVTALTDRVVDLQMLRLHGERLADLALTPPERRDAPAARPLGRQGGAPAALELRGVRFRYGEQEPWLLDGLDLVVEPGTSVAIVGGSGCGKTTLLKLLSSLLQPGAGELLVDGQPLARLGVEGYRSMIGVVMQDDQLFAGSIADNISFFSGAPDQELVEECARLAAVHDDVLAMPMGYGTLIGDMGTVLSGGQKQRVLLARALYRRPALLLLDEATSHLDVGREAEVNAALRECGITRVIVAHRPETIRTADRVLVLEGGKLLTAAEAERPRVARALAS